jgi:hypothetical protein
MRHFIQWVFICMPALALAQSSAPALVVASASTAPMFDQPHGMLPVSSSDRSAPVPVGEVVSEFAGEMNDHILPIRQPGGTSSEPEGLKVADSLWLRGLVGTWEAQVRGERYVETWSCANGECNGRAVSYKAAEESFVENTRIFKFHGQWLYLVAAGDSPVVCFVRTSVEGRTWVFSNVEHDFPQRIVYTLNGDDGLDAYIEGPGKDGDVRLEFNLKRTR